MEEGHQDYERLIRPIEDRMMRAVWCITRNPDDAEEAFQDALTTIWTKWDTVRQHPNPQALVLRMCFNAAYDVLRRKARRHRYTQLLRDQPAPGLSSSARIPCPSEALELQEQESAILRAVGRLSRHQAVAVMMRLVQGQSYSEIAHVLGCEEVTVRKHLERGRTRLQEMLGPWLRSQEREACL